MAEAVGMRRRRPGIDEEEEDPMTRMVSPTSQTA